MNNSGKFLRTLGFVLAVLAVFLLGSCTFLGMLFPFFAPDTTPPSEVSKLFEPTSGL